MSVIELLADEPMPDLGNLTTTKHTFEGISVSTHNVDRSMTKIMVRMIQINQSRSKEMAD